MKTNLYKYLFLLLCLISFEHAIGQGIKYDNVLWRLLSYNGIIGIRGDYRQRQTVFRNGKEEQKIAKILSGQIELDTKSYIWHPNFLMIDLNLQYNPGLQKDQFIVALDRSEVRSLEKVYGRVTFFSQRPVSLSAYYSYNHSYINRELTTDVDYYRKLLGGFLTLRNSFLPIRIDYTEDRWRQYELQTNRAFTNKSKKIRAEANKSFGTLDNGRLVISQEDYRRTYAWNAAVQNKISSLNFNENVYLNKRRTNSIQANIWLYRQVGSQSFDRIQALGSMNFDLLWNFRWRGQYRYFEYSNPQIDSKQNNYLAVLEHKLFKSLTSTFSYEYNDVIHTDYMRILKTGEVNFNYKKTVPTGFLRLFYHYRERGESWDNRDSYVRIVDEEHQMNDDEIILLEYPYVDLESIVVTDAQNSIVYQENIDYVLIERDIFVEIQRLPGGRIEPGALVYVDYIAKQRLQSEYTGITEGYGASISLFNNFLELYYRKSDLNYDNIQLEEYRILKVYNQQVYGAKIFFWRMTFGYEHDEFISNIVPYRVNRYYSTLNGYATNELSYALAVNWRDQYLTQEAELQNYANGSIRFTYRLNPLNKINLEGVYRRQRGRALDLDLLNLKLEFVTGYRQINLVLGAEIFQRDYSGERQDYGALYLRLDRKF